MERVWKGSDGKSNVIYGLCNGFGRSRPENHLFPYITMPMGLLEYMVNFFVTEHGNKVSTVVIGESVSNAPLIIPNGYRVKWSYL